MAAESLSTAARRAAALAQAGVRGILEPLITVDDAIAADSHVLPRHQHRLGDAAKALAAADHGGSRAASHLGGQEHFYLEGQVAMAFPQEDRDMLVLSSTQHPT